VKQDRQGPRAAVPPPPRVALRPNSADWSDDELMSLPEAAALFWPDGPLSTSSLRTAVKTGQLDVLVLARKFLTSKAAILRMSVCSARPAAAPAAAPAPLPQGVADAIGKICGS
jgi:hypothetical protein